MIDLVVVAVASGLAGFVDAVVGGGGLVLVPALFATYPNAVPATLFGTNKGGAIWGTAWAAVQFARRVTLARATIDRKSTRLNSSHVSQSRMPSSA